MKVPRRALTLLEVLMAVAIIAILVALVLPLLGQAKRRSQESVDISNLRQIGVATAIYNQEYGDPAPKVEVLVGAGLTPKEAVVSPLDRTKRGLANEMAAQTQQVQPPFRVSYRSLRAATDVEVSKVLATLGAGTVISLVETNYETNSHGTPNNFRGNYLRLCTDGSVQRRHVSWGNNKYGQVLDERWLYTDQPELFPLTP